jgi:hypothetical protein
LAVESLTLTPLEVETEELEVEAAAVLPLESRIPNCCSAKLLDLSKPTRGSGFLDELQEGKKSMVNQLSGLLSKNL